MKSNPILVRNITHLTDARYFAAMEVDWISIALSEDPVSFSKWHTLREWISGVKLAAEMRENDESLLAKTIIDANPEGIIFDNLDFVHMTGGIQFFLRTESLLPIDEQQFISQILRYNSCQGVLHPPRHELIYLEADWTPDLISELINKGYSGGICFSGGDETTVGVRNYSEFDKMIGLLRS